MGIDKGKKQCSIKVLKSIKKKTVSFQIDALDKRVQSTDKRRRFPRRGSRTPNMLRDAECIRLLMEHEAKFSATGMATHRPAVRRLSLMSALSKQMEKSTLGQRRRLSLDASKYALGVLAKVNVQS